MEPSDLSSTSTPTETSKPTETSSLRSRAKGCFRVAVILLGIGTLVCVAACGGFYFVHLDTVKQRPYYSMALEQIQASPEVVEELGEPIEDVGWWPRDQRSLSDNRGTASLDFQVQGPRGRADVHVRAQMINGTWGLSETRVTLPDNETIVLGPDLATLEDAPAWVPPSTPSTPPSTPPDPSDETETPPSIELELPTDISIDL